MRIKEIEARLAAIKQEIEQRGDAMTAAEIDALEQETTQLTEERAGLIAAAEKRNGILDNIAKGAGIADFLPAQESRLAGSRQSDRR